MKKIFSIILKRYIYPSALCVTIGSDMSGTMVHKNNLNYKVRQSAEQYLSGQDINTYNIPARLKPDYEYKLEGAQTVLYNRITSRGRTYANQSEIDRIVREKMKPFVDTMRSIIHSLDLPSKMNGFIRRFLWNQGVNPNRIPTNFQYDYESRKNRVTSKLNSMMLQDNRDYVRINEVEKAIRDEYSFFVSQLLDQLDTQHRPHSNQLSGLLDYLFDSATNNINTYDTYDTYNEPMDFNHQPSAPPYSSLDENKITLHHIEGHAQEIAQNILRNNNIDPNNIPARVVSHYSDAIQTITRRLRNIMTVDGRDYVWKSEIEAIAYEELQPIIDTIMYKGEICVVCQDEYDSGDRVGTLDCGHFYHDDCIRPWLSGNPSCPLCRADGVYIAKIETVP